MIKLIENAQRACVNAELANQLETAVEAALAAGALLRELFNKPHSIRMKGEIDLVTEADPAAEALIIRLLAEKYPEIPTLAEESAGEIPPEAAAGRIWVIDPLDGTTNYAHGLPHYCVSIALMEQGITLVGVIYCPMRNELFYAAKGAGAWLNGTPIKVTTTGRLIDALVATGFPYAIREHLDQILHQLAQTLPRVRDIRRAGAAALDLAYTACGRLDGFWEMDLKPWDTAAGWLLVEEAGGRVCDFQGGNYSPFKKEILACNGKLTNDLLGLLS